MQPRVLTWCLKGWWGLSQGGKLRCRVRLWRALPSEHPLEILIRQLDTRSVEEERGQNSRLGHYTDFTMPGPWVRVRASGVKRWEKNKFKDILTSTLHTRLLSGDIPSPLLCLFHVRGPAGTTYTWRSPHQS